MKKWTIEDAKELYNINGWGTSYFGINEQGNVYVTPCKDNTQIDLCDVMDELALRDVTAPVLLRRCPRAEHLTLLRQKTLINIRQIRIRLTAAVNHLRKARALLTRSIKTRII